MSVETCLPSDDGTSGAVPNMSSAPYRDILVEISEVSHITINRPERLNALAMTRTDQELSHAL
jgi:1,4-dihydroxy-2-naphthoyl-CoA synthase